MGEVDGAAELEDGEVVVGGGGGVAGVLVLLRREADDLAVLGGVPVRHAEHGVHRVRRPPVENKPVKTCYKGPCNGYYSLFMEMVIISYSVARSKFCKWPEWGKNMARNGQI